MTSDYFQDELRYLRQSGRLYSERFPKLASYLGSQATDPDVERMMEGFAFLTGRLRAKIDDQLPELTQSVIGLLCPQFLRPIPSFCIMQMRPIPGTLSKLLRVPAQTAVRSEALGEGSVTFQTTQDLDVLPLDVADVQARSSADRAVVSLDLRVTNRETLANIGFNSLHLFLGDDEALAQTMLLWCQRHLTQVALSSGQGDELSFAPSIVKRRGFSNSDRILPYPPNTFDGFRLLQEYYVFPEKFHFIDIEIPQHAVRKISGDQLRLMLRFDKPFPLDFKLNSRSFRLNCVPAVNLFSQAAEPIRLVRGKKDYPLNPMLRGNETLEIFSVDRVEGQSSEYTRFESFGHEYDGRSKRGTTFFKEFRRQLDIGRSTGVRLSFYNEDMSMARIEDDTLSIEITAMNGNRPADLAIGDVHVSTSSTPSAVLPINVTRPSRSWEPLLDGRLQWQLISSLALNFVSLQDAHALREILANLDIPARHDRKMELVSKQRLQAIVSIRSEPAERLFRGVPVRGTRTLIDVEESNFSSEGAMVLFGNVLDKLMEMFATVNSFHELTMCGLETGEEYVWATKPGSHPLI